MVCLLYLWSVRVTRGLFAPPVVCLYGMFALSVVCSRYPWSVCVTRGLFALPVIFLFYPWSVRATPGLFALSVVCSRYPWSVCVIRGLFALPVVCLHYLWSVRATHGLFALHMVCSGSALYFYGPWLMLASWGITNPLDGTVARDFDFIFYCLKHSGWSLYEQAKTIWKTCSFLRRYSIAKFEICLFANTEY